MNLGDMIAAGPLGELGVEGIAAGANFLVLFILYRTFLPNDAVNARARSLARRRKELRSMLLAPGRSGKRARQSVTFMRGLLERLKLTRGDESRRSSDLLAKAGWRNSDALTVFLGVRLGAPVAGGAVLYVLAPVLIHPLPMALHAVVALAGLGLGAYSPSLFVNNAITKRKQLIQKGLPDALDLFVICAEAGLSLDAAMMRVSRELGPNAPELADEFGLTAIELGFLPNRRDALGNLTKRVDTPSVRGLVTTLAQTEKYGTPLAQALRVLASEFRHTRMMKAEEKAARLPAILTVPMMLFILPPLFVILIGPAIIQVLAAMAK